MKINDKDIRAIAQSFLTIGDIRIYLSEVATEVREDEEDEYVELMMDNHRCIVWEGKQYYIPEENNFVKNQTIYDYLYENHAL